MQKKFISFLLIINIIFLLIVFVMVQKGSFTEIEEVQYVAEEGTDTTYTLTQNTEVTFRFNNSLKKIDNLILKLTGCKNHINGQLSVKIYDKNEIYYTYEVPVSAFADDLFYLYTNAISGMEDNKSYYVTIAVQDMGQDTIFLHLAEERYLNVADGNVSPFWGCIGSDVHISQVFGKMMLIWGILNAVVIVVAVFIKRFFTQERKEKIATTLRRFCAKIKSFQRHVYICFGVLVGLCILAGVAAHQYGDNVVEEQMYEYWAHHNVSEFTNIPVKNGELIQSFTAGYNQLEQFILLFDNYATTDGATLTTNLEDSEGNVYYSWSAKTAKLSGETFCLMAAVEEELSRGQEYYLRVYLDNSQSDITVRAITAKDIHQSVGEMTVAGEKQGNTVLYFSQSYRDFFSYAKLWYWVMAITVLAFLLVMCCNRELCLKMWGVISVLLLPAVSYYSIETLSGNWHSIEAQYALVNCIIILGIYFVAKAVFGRAAYYMVALLTFLAGVVNYYVLQFRGSELLLSDIKSFSTAMSVAGNYEFTLPPVVFTGIILYACLLFIQTTVDIRCSGVYKKAGLRGRAVSLCAGLVAAILVSFNVSNVEFNFFTLSYSFSKFGWCYSNICVLKFSSVEKPLGYSDERVENIIEKIEEPESEVIKPKNLIVIMNESFSDLSKVGELETNRDYMPFIRSLSENTVKGNLHVSTFGGNTCITEYEFLTGNSRHFMPIGSIPYSNSSVFEGEEEGMVRILQEQGYYAVAMHPYGPTNWNRDKVYPAMGFDEFISIDSYQDAELIRNYVSDKSDYDKIIEYYESFEGENLFVFNVTMQNHGGYDVNNGTVDTSVTIENFDSDVGETYLSLVNESDKAFEYLLSYFSEVDEPTMIVMFGDHLPSLPNSFYEMLYDKDLDSRNDLEESLLYITPYIIWTNYDSDFEQVPDTSVNYLGRMVLQYAGLEMSQYDKFLLEQREEIPVVGKFGIYDRNGQYTVYEDVAAKTLENYQILQYMRMEDRDSDLYSIFSIDEVEGVN